MSSFVGVETPWLQAPLFGSRATAFELDQYAIALALLLVVLVPVVASALLGSKGNRLPIVNAPGPFQLEVQKKFEFIHNGMKFLREGRQCFPGKPSVLSEGVLLYTVTEPLAIETSFTVSKSLGEKHDWFEVTIYKSLVDIVARISTRVFLGPEIFRDDAWLEITKNFTLSQVKALATIMKLFPYYLRPLVYFLDPNGRKAMELFYRGRKMVDPLVARRRKERQEPEPPAYNDAIEWADLESGGQPYDPTDFQLALASVAIHATTDLLSKTLLHLAAGDPEVYDMRRFANMRSSGQEGAEHGAHLVSAVPEHITFGYGKHVCPGRFFAANEIKMALCHLLMNHDWKLAPGTTLEPVRVGTDPLSSQEAKMLCRSRKAEFEEVDDAAE